MHKGGFLLLLTIGLTAHAAGIDCSKARTAREKTVCASPELMAADNRMTAAYRDILAVAPAEIKPGIRDGQRQWLLNLGFKCNDQAAPSNCLRDSYDARTKALQGMVLHAGGVTFVWRSYSVSAAQPAGNRAAAKSDPDKTGPDDAGPDNQGPGKLEASWPQATIDTPQWKAWNRAIEAQAQMMASDGKPGAWPKDWDADMDASIGASVGFVSDQLVTAAMNDFTYGHGAAHPNNGSIQLNWLLQKQRELRPDDVFKSGSNWEQALQSQCDRYLRKTLGDDYADFLPNKMPTVIHGIVVNPHNWRLDAKGVTIVFQTYAVACRACTPDPLTIPWDDLKVSLNPEFSVPK